MNIKQSFDEIDAASVDELIKKISSKYDIKYNELKNSVVLINGKNMMNQKGLRTELHNGDEVQMLSPVAGG
jgi:molybdopterin converting factor small subunit